MIPNRHIHLILALPNPGFASFYSFSESDALLVRERGHSRGLAEFSVWADQVPFDIDNGERGLNALLAVLNRDGYQYEVWLSGGKGYHVYVPHSPIYDIRLPYSHAAFVESLGVACDASLYQHSRVLRLPGTIHPDTGKRKVFITRKEGRKAEVAMVEPPSFNFSPRLAEKSVVNAMSAAISLINNPPPTGQGKRHTLIWGAAKDFAEAGTPYVTALGVLLEVNRTWVNPKPIDKVEKAVVQAYRHAGCEPR